MRRFTRIMVLVCILLTLCINSAYAEQYDYVIESGRHVAIPKTYNVKKVIYDLGGKSGNFKEAEDLFIDKNGVLYVADTGNNRIVKMTTSGNVLNIFTGPANKPLKTPKGVYVDKDGEIYVADTGNKRILHMSPQGEYVEEFIKPESDLLGSDFSFEPSKVYVNSTGYIYLIKSQSFMSMDANNQFRGFIGATEVGFDLNSFLVRMFASKEQKKRVAKKQPAAYSNFVIDDYGMIYAITANSATSQIRKINSIGKNIYKEQFFGEKIQRDNKEELPSFVDIAVDKSGIISALEQKGGKIYQYDQEGNLLTVFGGTGRWKGVFEMPTSLAVDMEGNIYVLDSKMNNIQVFEPTRFIKAISKAVTLYANGEYPASKNVWYEVLKIDASYSLAHMGIGKVLVKEEKWREAMEEYRMIGDKTGYSAAFTELRHGLVRKYFGMVVLLIAAGCGALWFLFLKLRSVADKAWQEGV